MDYAFCCFVFMGRFFAGSGSVFLGAKSTKICKKKTGKRFARVCGAISGGLGILAPLRVRGSGSCLLEESWGSETLHGMPVRACLLC